MVVLDGTVLAVSVVVNLVGLAMVLVIPVLFIVDATGCVGLLLFATIIRNIEHNLIIKCDKYKKQYYSLFADTN